MKDAKELELIEARDEADLKWDEAGLKRSEAYLKWVEAHRNLWKYRESKAQQGGQAAQ